MKASELRNIIREEITNVLKENFRTGDRNFGKSSTGKMVSGEVIDESGGYIYIVTQSGTVAKCKKSTVKLQENNTVIKETAEYFPARMIKHLQRAILAALKDGTIRIVGKGSVEDTNEYPGYAEDIAVELIRGKSLKDIINNL